MAVTLPFSSNSKLCTRYASLLDDGPLRDWPDLFAQECCIWSFRATAERGLPLAIIAARTAACWSTRAPPPDDHARAICGTRSGVR
jgi:hypothetical protein